MCWLDCLDRRIRLKVLRGDQCLASTQRFTEDARIKRKVTLPINTTKLNH